MLSLHPKSRKIAVPEQCPDRASPASPSPPATRELVGNLGLIPVVPPKDNRKEPWPYDKKKYRKRNETERLFRRLKGYRRIATRYDKLDIVYGFFILLALIVEALR